MQKFLIETFRGKVIHDFVFQLTLAQPYYGWLDEAFTIRGHENNGFDDIKAPDKYVPVGSVEFVAAYLQRFYPEREDALRPLNVPECLFPFAGRRIVNVWYSEDYRPLKGIKNVYAKSMDTIKDQFNGPYYDVPANYEWKDFQHCQVSELIGIESEWRVFVFHNKILGIANYSGFPLLFPDAEAIREMTKAYAEEAPVAYTLDVAYTNNGDTVPIECHRFFSCGLYGFTDLVRYPKMLSQAWFEMIHPKNTP